MSNIFFVLIACFVLAILSQSEAQTENECKEMMEECNSSFTREREECRKFSNLDDLSRILECVKDETFQSLKKEYDELHGKTVAPMRECLSLNVEPERRKKRDLASRIKYATCMGEAATKYHQCIDTVTKCSSIENCETLNYQDLMDNLDLLSQKSDEMAESFKSCMKSAPPPPPPGRR